MSRYDPEADGQRYVANFDRMSDEERAAMNRRVLADGERRHVAFRNAFRVGRCVICGEGLESFHAKRPCLHWLLRPNGVRKSDLKGVLTEAGAMRAQAFLRWIASEEGGFENINDMAADVAPKPVEVTIRFRDLEWSISCATSDLRGHGTGLSAFPHFHFQMRISGRPFINYNDFHIPLHRDETAFLHAQQIDARFVAKFPGGSGMADVLTDENLEALVELAPAAQEGDGHLHLQTMVMAREGEGIDGQQLERLLERARNEGRTFASVARELSNVSVVTMVSPGPAVVEVAERQGGRGKRR